MQALYNNTTGFGNVALGQNALYDLNITANDGSGNNTALGYNTGRGIATGIDNTIVGANVTGLSSTLSNNIIIADGSGNQRINVNRSGNVGMGTTTPQSKLAVPKEVSIGADYDTAAPTNGLIVEGKLGIAASTSPASPQATLDYTGSTEDGLILNDTNASAGSEFVRVNSNSLSAGIGSIQNISNTSVAYNTTSDLRLKQNIATTTAGLATLMQIPVVDFNYINDPTHTRRQASSRNGSIRRIRKPSARTGPPRPVPSAPQHHGRWTTAVSPRSS